MWKGRHCYDGEGTAQYPPTRLIPVVVHYKTVGGTFLAAIIITFVDAHNPVLPPGCVRRLW